MSVIEIYWRSRLALGRPAVLAAAASVALSLTAIVVTLSASDSSLAAVVVALSAVAAVGAVIVIRRSDRSFSTTAELISPAQQWQPRRHRRTRVTPDELPRPSSTFRGRLTELRQLEKRHNKSRGRRRDNPRAGRRPTLLLIHGMPGVGKSALAQKLAANIAVDYPDGKLFANLGYAGGARPPAEILHGFLLALGLPEEAMPVGMAERANMFRSLTSGRRILLLLDATRDFAQLKSLVPSEPQCTVIVTSRRDLGPFLGVRSLRLRPPDHHEALEIFRAVSNSKEGDQPEYAAEIVSLCGAHPLAVKAAAELATHTGTNIADTAREIRREDTRIARLDSLGRDVAERITSEYRRLVDNERKAFRYLSIVDSRSFVPWVLRPLLDVPFHEAENLLAALASAQLVATVGGDDVTKIDRYELHPLSALVSRDLLRREDDGDDVRAARRRLNQAYLEAADRVLRRLDPFYQESYPLSGAEWLPEESALSAGIARVPKQWVRAEYHNLLGAIQAAHNSGAYGLCWRIAAWLGGCVPQRVNHTRVMAAFELAVAAAEADRTPNALVDVLLSRGAFLSAIERYSEAFIEFSQALRLCEAGAATSGSAVFAARRATTERRIGEALFQAGEYSSAALRFQAAHARYVAIGDVTGAELAEIMSYLVGPPALPEKVLYSQPVDDSSRYWATLARAEVASWAERWDAVVSELQALKDGVEYDVRRTAAVSYRLARAYLGRHQAEIATGGAGRGGARPVPRTESSRRAVRFAAVALGCHIESKNRLGQVRARCLLASALLEYGQIGEAERQVDLAQSVFRGLDEAVNNSSSPLAATMTRACGELALARGDDVGGRRLLLTAAATYARNADWRSLTEIAFVLGEEPRPLFAEVTQNPSATRLISAYVEKGQLLSQVDQAVDIRVRVHGRALRGESEYLSDGQVTVMLTAEGAHVWPGARSIPIPEDDVDTEVVFAVRPGNPGPIPIKIQVYSLADGVLLQEYQPTIVPYAA